MGMTIHDTKMGWCPSVVALRMIFLDPVQGGTIHDVL
jgi:hypothetical protein